MPSEYNTVNIDSEVGTSGRITSDVLGTEKYNLYDTPVRFHNQKLVSRAYSIIGDLTEITSFSVFNYICPTTEISFAPGIVPPVAYGENSLRS